MEKQLLVKLGTEVKIQIKGDEYRTEGILVGLEINNWLLIKIHNANDWSLLVQSYLFNKKAIIIRYLHKGIIFGFQSNLIQTIATPARMIFIKYPKIIEQHKLRNFKRIDCSFPAKIVAGGSIYKGVISDISENGCNCITKVIKELTLLKTEEQIGITFPLPGEVKDITMIGKIMNIKTDSDKISIGVNFVNIQPDNQSKIIQYISGVEQFW